MAIKAQQYSSHIPVLLKVLQMTDGEVMEMGTGYFSTPLIHWLCIPKGRYVLSLESHAEYLTVANDFKGPLHEVRLLKTWDEAPCRKDWDLVMVDHDPAIRRRTDIARLAQFARLIVIHDTSPSQDHAFQYGEVWPLFKYVRHYHDLFPGTSIVSNFMELEGLDL